MYVTCRDRLKHTNLHMQTKGLAGRRTHVVLYVAYTTQKRNSAVGFPSTRRRVTGLISSTGVLLIRAVRVTQ